MYYSRTEFFRKIYGGLGYIIFKYFGIYIFWSLWAYSILTEYSRYGFWVLWAHFGSGILGRFGRHMVPRGGGMPR